MKKLLLLFVLFVGMTGFAQKTMFFKQYNNALFTKNGITEEWIKVDVSIFYNYNDNPDKIKIYFGNTPAMYTQEGGTVEGKTVSGYTYSEMHMVDDVSGERLIILFFHDHEEYGIRVVFENRDYVELRY